MADSSNSPPWQPLPIQPRIEQGEVMCVRVVPVFLGVATAWRHEVAWLDAETGRVLRREEIR